MLFNSLYFNRSETNQRKEEIETRLSAFAFSLAIGECIMIIIKQAMIRIISNWDVRLFSIKELLLTLHNFCYYKIPDYSSNYSKYKN